MLKEKKIRSHQFSVSLLCAYAAEYVSSIPKFCHLIFFFSLFLGLEFLSNCRRLYAASQSSPRKWQDLLGDKYHGSPSHLTELFGLQGVV